jgi:Cys-tRNA(Pro) deacylase
MTDTETAATRWLSERGVVFKRHVLEHVMVGKETLSQSFARQLGADEYRVLKTMVLEDQDGPQAAPPFVLVMHGNVKIDVRKVATAVGVRRVRLCPAERASAYTGYRFGGTSPFGLARASELRVYAERTIADTIPAQETIWINGGSGVLVVSMTREALLSVLQPTLINGGA